MKSLMLILQEALYDVGRLCDTSVTRDLEYIARRVEHEGDSFLTITLPDFGKAFERSLDKGLVTHDSFQGFPWKSGLPKLFSGFLELVFDRNTGRLLDEPNLPAIWAVRQITLMFGKVARPCTPERELLAMKAYVQCEQEVRESDAVLFSTTAKAEQRRKQFLRIRTLLYSNLFYKVQCEVRDLTLVPKHGPGATADRKLGNAKWIPTEWPVRAEAAFPIADYLIPSHRHFDELDVVNFLEPEDERPVRVVSVPKTLKTPRIIAIEPTCMQYMQQGLLGSFVRHIEDNHLLRALLGWSSAEGNHYLAKKGSSNGSVATLDLKEASDRVSNQQVRLLFEGYPDLYDAVDSCRSRKADVDGFGIISLAKFASMGSALTFPMEAMIFLIVSLMGVENALNRRLSFADLYDLSGEWMRVYGDDIIVPTYTVDSVVEELGAFGYQVNLNKSFWNGKFRESCGKDYYSDVDVSTVKCRADLPTHRQDVSALLSAFSFRNQLYMAGMWGTAEYVGNHIRSLGIPTPRVEPTSAVLGFFSFLGFDSEKEDPDLHRPLVRGVQVKYTYPRNAVDGVWALHKVFSLSDQSTCVDWEDRIDPLGLPNRDAEHLRRSGRPSSARTITRWGSPV
jgi:hypothetical protein